MLDNWTVEEFFKELDLMCWNLESGALEHLANQGRIAIIDDPELEKTFDQFVQANDYIHKRFSEWRKTI